MVSKKFLITIVTLIVVALATGVAIFLAKGYTFSPSEQRIVGTGILTVASRPDSASVFVDGHLTTATNATIPSLPPKKYTVRVVKEGFIPWEKEVEIKEGLVTELKLTLFPAIPSIYPLTVNGVLNPVLSPNGDKLVYIVPTDKKAGVWVWTMAKDQPISFARSSEPHQIFSNAVANYDLSKVTLRWSPDSQQVLMTTGDSNLVLDSERSNTDPRDITPTLSSTLNTWEEDTQAAKVARLSTMTDGNLRKIASDSAIVSWSPDETKFIAREKALTEEEKDKPVTGMKVYVVEDEAGLPTKEQFDLPAAKHHIWLPDSEHIILVEDGSLSIMDYDGTNKAVIYAGNFLNGFVFPWPDSSRLVFITSFPTPTASQPNLYGINLK